MPDYSFDTAERVKCIMRRLTELKKQKQYFLSAWDLCALYVLSRKQNFTSSTTPGQIMGGENFDNTAATSAQIAKSSFIGHLWPNSSKTFRIEPLNMPLNQTATKEVKDYFEKVTQIVRDAFDAEYAGFDTANDEYMLEQVVFGTGGLAAFENLGEDADETPVRFECVDVKNLYIAEGPNGAVDTVYIERNMTVKQMAQEYSYDALSAATKDLFRQGKLDQELCILQAIEPRLPGESKGSFGNKSYPIASVHIEVKAKHILRESGYHEMPIFVSRFWKLKNEVYGRSPATEGMPNIISLNVLQEMVLRASELYLRPPMGIVDDGTLNGGNGIDLSAEATNVFRTGGRLGDANINQLIQPIHTVGEVSTTYDRITVAQQDVRIDFFVDRLMDLNNQNEMTLGEANIRNGLRALSLGSIFSRQVLETYGPLVRRVFNILFRQGRLGLVKNTPEWVQAKAKEAITGIPVFEVPDAVAQNPRYKVKFISPAARIMEAETLTGIQQTMDYAITIQPVYPEVMDVLNVDAVIQSVQDLAGAPPSIIRGSDEVEQIRSDRAAAQQEAMELQAKQAQMDIAKSGAQAAQSASKAVSE